MATSSKKRRVNVEEDSVQKSHVSKENINSESSEEETEGDFQSDGDSDELDLNEEIQVEFEALPPQADDFHGIKRLLQQLFLKSSVNLAALTDLILAQNHVGSVIKQSADQLAELDMDSNESDDDDEENIFGFISVIDISNKKNEVCIQEIKTLLEERCSKCASATKKAEFSHMINNSSHSIGFLINERFINIPPQLAPPLHRSLQKDLTKASATNTKFKFDYYLMISKTYKEALSDNQQDSGSTAKKKSTGTRLADTELLMFANAEDEYFYQESVMSFDYSVTDESDTALAGKWSFEDAEMRTFRTVMIVPTSKMPISQDLTKASATNTKFKFDYYLMISKTYKEALSDNQQDSGSTAKKKSTGTRLADSELLMFANAEDEYFYQESVMSFDYSVTDESDTALAGKWSFEDAEMRTFRTVMIVPTSKMPNILSQIDDNLTV